MNIIMITGRLTREPKFTVTTNTKTEVATFDVAVQRARDKEKTDFFKCTAYGPVVTSFIKPYIHKGDKVFVKGNFEINTYPDKDEPEKKRYYSDISINEIELLQSVENKSQDIQDVQKVKDEYIPQEPAIEDLPF